MRRSLRDGPWIEKVERCKFESRLKLPLVTIRLSFSNSNRSAYILIYYFALPNEMYL